MDQLFGLQHRRTDPVIPFPSEITAISSGNHGNNCKKSRQLLAEITATS
jgi:hypothetical protein